MSFTAFLPAGLEVPPFFDDHPGAATPDANGKLLPVCLVDHNEDKQMVPSLRDAPDRKKRIIGLIDHHVPWQCRMHLACTARAQEGFVNNIRSQTECRYITGRG